MGLRPIGNATHIDFDVFETMQSVLVHVFSSRSYFAKVEKAEAAAQEAEAAEAADAACALDDDAEVAPKAKAKCKGKAKAKPKSGTKRKAANAALDETAEDEMHAWETKMGKWAKGGIAGVQSHAFWIFMLAANVIFERLDVLSFMIMKKRDDVGTLAYLLYSGATQVLDSMETLLVDSSAWVDVRDFVNRYCPDMLAKADDICMRLVARVIASYQRRVIDRLRSMPIRLLWFAVSPPDDPNLERLRLAQYLLDTLDDMLHVTARKVNFSSFLLLLLPPLR